MANHPKKVLVGIISKNRVAILPTAIRSALAQKYKPISVSVFDDNSSDNTKSLELEFENIDWHFSPSNKGYVFGRNKLMRETNATYYCSLDDDSWFIKGDELQIAIAELDSNSDIAAIAFDILSPDRPDECPISKGIETNNFIGCGHVLRLSAVKEVGYYDANPGFYGGEESDLCIKLMNNGYKIIKLPGVHVWHDKTMVARDEKSQYRSIVCNDLVFAYRRIPGIKVVAVVLVKILSHLKFTIRSSNLRLVKPFLQGLRDFVIILSKNNIKRSPVSEDTFKKYFRFNR